MSQPSNPLAVAKPWDLVAEEYEKDIVPQFAGFARDALRLAGVAEGMLVVDVACGPGTLCFEAVRLKAHVSAIDFSPEMIRRLQLRAGSVPAGAIETQVGDGMALPFADASFDAAFSMFGLMFFPDRGKGFQELGRVLKPKGCAVVSSWVPVERVPLLADIYGTLAGLLPGSPFGAIKPPLADPAEFRAEMEAAGLRDVHVHEVEHGLVADSVDQYWTTVARSTPHIRLIREHVGAEAWAALSIRMLDRLHERWGTGPQHVPMIANLAVGRRA